MSAAKDKLLSTVPAGLQSVLPPDLKKQIRYIRFVDRISSKKRKLKRVLIVHAAIIEGRAAILVARSDGQIARVIELAQITDMALVAPKGKPTLVISVEDQSPLIVQMSPYRANPSRTVPADFARVVNKLERELGLRQHTMLCRDETVISNVNGPKVTPKQFLEGVEKQIDEAKEQWARGSGEPEKGAEETNIELVESEELSGSTGTSSADEAASEEKVEKSELDQRWEEQFDAKLQEVADRRKQLHAAMEQLKQDATTTPSQSVLDQALEDASGLDDDATLTPRSMRYTSGASEGGLTDLGLPSPAASTSASTTTTSSTTSTATSTSASTSVSVPTSSSSLRTYQRITGSLPRTLLELAAHHVPPGTQWSDLRAREKLRILQRALVQEVVVTKLPGERIGIRLGVDGIVGSVLPGTVAQRMGLNQLTGHLLTHIDGMPIRTVQDIGCNNVRQAKVVRLLFVDPKSFSSVGPNKYQGTPCPCCGSPCGSSDLFCGGCGTRKNAGRRGQGGKPILAAARTLRTRFQQPPKRPPQVPAKHANLQQLILSDVVARDAVGCYLESITRQCASIASGSSHSSDRAARHGYGERRLWGKSSKIGHPPWYSWLQPLLHEHSNPAEEISRLSLIVTHLEEGRWAPFLERYRLHLQLELYVARRWLAGCARAAGATGDPRRKQRKRRRAVLRWLQAVVPPPPPPPLSADSAWLAPPKGVPSFETLPLFAQPDSSFRHSAFSSEL